MRITFSGVNPTDWKRRTSDQPVAGGQIPNQDGSGTIDAVGQGVASTLLGERVWIWEAAWKRPFGTAAEYTVVPWARPCRSAPSSFDWAQRSASPSCPRTGA